MASCREQNTTDHMEGGVTWKLQAWSGKGVSIRGGGWGRTLLHPWASFAPDVRPHVAQSWLDDIHLSPFPFLIRRVFGRLSTTIFIA